MKKIKMHKKVGSYGENKDIAREIRVKELLPALEMGEKVVLDFAEVESATQSFIHALISDVIRKQGIGVLDKVVFMNCNGTIKKLVEIVAEYMQEDHS